MVEQLAISLSGFIMPTLPSTQLAGCVCGSSRDEVSRVFRVVSTVLPYRYVLVNGLERFEGFENFAATSTRPLPKHAPK